MPTDTGMTYPFPYKTENGSFGDLPDPFQVNNLVVLNDAVVQGDLSVSHTIESSAISTVDATAHQFTATNTTNQFNTTQSDMDFKTQDMNPEFNFKNSADQTYFSTVNAGEFKGTFTTNVASLNGLLLTTQTNTHSGVNNEAGFSARTSADAMDIVMVSDSRRGQVRTSSDAFGLDIVAQGSSKSIKLNTNGQDRLTVLDVGVQIPALGATTPGTIQSTTLTTTDATNVNVDVNTAPVTFAGGVIVTKTLVAGSIDKSPIGGSIPSTIVSTTINTTDTTPLNIDYSTDVVSSDVTINTLTAPNSVAGGLILNETFGKKLSLLNPDLPSTSDLVVDALQVLQGNTSLTTVTSDVLTSKKIIASDSVDVASLSNYNAVFPTLPSIATLGGILVNKGVSADTLLVRGTADYDTLNPLDIPINCLGGVKIAKTLAADSLLATSTTIATATDGPIVTNGGILVKKNVRADTIQTQSLNNATTKTTGSIQVAGGVGISKDLWADNVFAGKGTFTDDLKGKTLLVDQHAAVETLDVTKSTNSTSTTTGAVTLAGGLGVAQDIWADNIHAATKLFSKDIQVDETMQTDQLKVMNGNNSSGTTTGAATIVGGLGVGKDVWANNLHATALVKGNDVEATNSVKGASIESTGLLKGATITSTGTIEGTEITATSEIVCGVNTINATGIVTTGTLTAGATTVGTLNSTNIDTGAVICGDVTAGNVTCGVLESTSVTTGAVTCAAIGAADITCAALTSTSVATGGVACGAVGAGLVTCLGVLVPSPIGAAINVGLPLVSITPTIACSGTGATIKAIGPASLMGADKGLFREIRCEDLDPTNPFDPPPLITCAGDIGGQNLRSYGNLNVDNQAFITGAGVGLDVTNDVHIHGNLTVDGITTTGEVSLHLTGTGTALTVDHDALVSGTLTAGTTTLTDTGLVVLNKATVGGTLGVTGTTTLGVLNSGAHSATTLAATATGVGLAVTNNTTIGGKLWH